ncbi:putative transposase [Escherichia coli]|nr:putative transposase [Escherichia coli]CAD5736454.1 putative transposase [Escherichia coli]
MQRHFEQHKALPLMILMLFYHRERSPYPYSMSWLDCFENSALAAKTCTELFHLVDMTAMKLCSTANVSANDIRQ